MTTTPTFMSTVGLSGLAMLLVMQGVGPATALASTVKQSYQRSSQSSVTVRRSGSGTTQTSVVTSTSSGPISVGSMRRSIPIYRSNHRQQTMLSLRRSQLSVPHTLTIELDNGHVTGLIKVDGETVHTLTARVTSLDLTPYLSGSSHQVEIMGSYAPISETVKISFSGPGTQMSQQSSGSGILNHQLQISVQ